MGKKGQANSCGQWVELKQDVSYFLLVIFTSLLD